MLVTGIFVSLMVSDTIPLYQKPYAVVGFIIFTFGAVFYLIYHLLLKNRILKKRLRKTGVAAIGTIISTAETSMRINNRPVLKIQIDIHDKLNGKFTATVYKTASILSVSGLMPGNKINVLFNPQNTNEVVIDD